MFPLSQVQVSFFASSELLNRRLPKLFLSPALRVLGQVEPLRKLKWVNYYY